jgi:hypothetical protein
MLIHKLLSVNQGASWREFWALYTCLACYLSAQGNRTVPSSFSKSGKPINLTSELQVINWLEEVMNVGRIGLRAKDWLQTLDQESLPDTILLFDGLDTGFGNSDADRNRRREAIEGLFSLITTEGDTLKNLRFKVFLRQDIWRDLRSENKSHFFGRSVTIAWNNKADFLKVVIKQALRSEKFKELVMSVGSIPLSTK